MKVLVLNTGSTRLMTCGGLGTDLDANAHRRPDAGVAGRAAGRGKAGKLRRLFLLYGPNSGGYNRLNSVRHRRHGEAVFAGASRLPLLPMRYACHGRLHRVRQVPEAAENP